MTPALRGRHLSVDCVDSYQRLNYRRNIARAKITGDQERRCRGARWIVRKGGAVGETLRGEG